MPKVDMEAASLLTKEMRSDLMALFTKYSDRASRVAINSEDPHTPVIACMQMAMAHTAVQYLVISGLPPPVAFNTTVLLTQKAMGMWIQSATAKPNEPSKKPL